MGIRIKAAADPMIASIPGDPKLSPKSDRIKNSARTAPKVISTEGKMPLWLQPHFSNTTATTPAIIKEPKNENNTMAHTPKTKPGAIRAPRK